MRKYDDDLDNYGYHDSVEDSRSAYEDLLRELEYSPFVDYSTLDEDFFDEDEDFTGFSEENF